MDSVYSLRICKTGVFLATLAFRFPLRFYFIHSTYLYISKHMKLLLGKLRSPRPLRYYIPWPPASRSLRSPTGYSTFRGLHLRSLAFLRIASYIIYIYLLRFTSYPLRCNLQSFVTHRTLFYGYSARFAYRAVVPSASYVRHLPPPLSPFGSRIKPN